MRAAIAPFDLLTVKFASHQLAPGSLCVAALPVANDDASVGKVAEGAEDRKYGHPPPRTGGGDAATTPAEEMEDANAGQNDGSLLGSEPGCRS